jgi:hypothetical protein
MAGGAASALGTVTRNAYFGEKPMDPLFVDEISVVGDADYATDGTAGLLAALQALTSDSRTIVGAVCVSGGGYVAEYLVATDKIKVWCIPAISGDGAAAQALEEVAAGADLHGTTFRFLVFSK